MHTDCQAPHAACAPITPHGLPTLDQLARPSRDAQSVVLAPSLAELRRAGPPPAPVGEQHTALPYGLQPWGKTLALQPGLGRFRRMVVPAIGIDNAQAARPTPLLLFLTVSYDAVPYQGQRGVVVSLSVDRGDGPCRPDHRGDWRALAHQLEAAIARQGFVYGHVQIIVEAVGSGRVESIDASGLALPMLTALFDGLCGGARRGRVAPTQEERRWAALMPAGGLLLPVGDLMHGDKASGAVALSAILRRGSPLYQLNERFQSSGLVPVLLVPADDVQGALGAGVYTIGCDVVSDLRLLIQGDKRRAPLPRVPSVAIG